ncbi:MAG TPA: hypothetical protein PLR99_19975 [Polyangiaceae bacterium]|nr:hypothetical protein [Polyangiaceae bacterium]
MPLFDVRPANAPLLLAAMRAVALADGEESPKERALLEAARDALSLVEPLEAFPPDHLTDDALAALDAGERERVLQAMLLMAIMDGAGSPEEAALVSSFAARLGVSEPRVANLEALARGRHAFMWLDLTRKGYPASELLATVREEGLTGVLRTFGPIVGLGKSADIVRKYNDLGRLPEGTLGREYWRFITQNELGFPGEGPVGERGVWHDMIHVVGGYPVTPAGEAEVVAFMAGFRKEDPFFWVFTSVLQFQVGLRISPFSKGIAGQIDPRSYLAHHRRGARVSCDLSRDWDFRADLEVPLAELRQRFAVPPLPV